MKKTKSHSLNHKESSIYLQMLQGEGGQTSIAEAAQHHFEKKRAKTKGRSKSPLGKKQSQMMEE